MKIFIGINAGNWKLGFEYAPIVHKDGGPYMTRWVVYLLWVNLRLHQFFRGDYDRASHTHPWWFVTFPFTSYQEWVYEKGKVVGSRVVEAWRFHWRPSSFEHVVKYPLKTTRTLHGWIKTLHWTRSTKPFWTFVIAGRPGQTWGFYTPDGKFHPYGDE